jgi:hypothetical protein
VIASGVPVRSPAVGRRIQELGVPIESAIAGRDSPVLLVTGAALYLPTGKALAARAAGAENKSIARACAAGI